MINQRYDELDNKEKKKKTPENIHKPKPISQSNRGERIGSKTAPVESTFDFEIPLYEEEGSQDYIASYNYYIYYNSIKPRDPRLPKPRYRKVPDIHFIKGSTENIRELDEKFYNFTISIDREAPNVMLNIQDNEKCLKENFSSKPTDYSDKDINEQKNINSKKFTNFPPINLNIANSNIGNINTIMYYNYDYNRLKDCGAIKLPTDFLKTPYVLKNQINENNIPTGYNYYSRNHSLLNDNFQNGEIFHQPLIPFQSNIYPANGQILNNNNVYKKANINNTLQFNGKINQYQFNTDLTEILPNIINYCKDHSGSRIVQNKYEEGTEEEKDKILSVLLPNIYSMSKDLFGNYVIQKILENNENNNKRISFIMKELEDYIYELSLHMYGCRVIQKAVDIVNLENLKAIYDVVIQNITSFIEDQNGNHVVQKLIERIPQEQQKEIISALKNNFYQLAVHQYGCRVLQKLFENCLFSDFMCIIDDLLKRVRELTEHQYGNYVIQNILEKQNSNIREKILQGLRGKIFEFSIHKFASNVIEKLLNTGDKSIVDQIYKELISNDENNNCLYSMVKDKYGNYVVQKLIEVANFDKKEEIVKRVITSQSLKKRDGFSKHVITFIEKMGYNFPTCLNDKIQNGCSSFELY